MKTRKRRKPKGFTPPTKPAKPAPVTFDDRVPPGDARGGYVQIHNYESPYPVKARFLEVDTPELLVIDSLEVEVEAKDVRGRFVKVAPRLAPADRDKFDGPGIARVLRGWGARAVVLAPVMVGEVTRVEPEKVARRTPREAVKSWFEEQRGIEVGDRNAALEKVFGYMDEENL